MKRYKHAQNTFVIFASENSTYEIHLKASGLEW